MPRRRRTPKDRIGGVTPAQKRWCLNPFAALDEPETCFADEAQARAVWEANRDAWLGEYAAQHPGERPPAALRFDAPAEPEAAL